MCEKRKFRIIIITMAVLGFLVFSSCSSVQRDATVMTVEDDIEIYTMVGKILSVSSGSFLEPESLEILDGDGRVWVFSNIRTLDAMFSVSHFRQLMLLGTPVDVTYSISKDGLILESMSDAP